MDALSNLCSELDKNNWIKPNDYQKYHVKRGLRNEDGTGVMAGLTRICSVEGYYILDGERIPKDGKLSYRGYDINDIVLHQILFLQADERLPHRRAADLQLRGQLLCAYRGAGCQLQRGDIFSDNAVDILPDGIVLRFVGRAGHDMLLSL